METQPIFALLDLNTSAVLQSAQPNSHFTTPGMLLTPMNAGIGCTHGETETVLKYIGSFLEGFKNLTAFDANVPSFKWPLSNLSATIRIKVDQDAVGNGHVYYTVLAGSNEVLKGDSKITANDISGPVAHTIEYMFNCGYAKSGHQLSVLLPIAGGDSRKVMKLRLADGGDGVGYIVAGMVVNVENTYAVDWSLDSLTDPLIVTYMTDAGKTNGLPSAGSLTSSDLAGYFSYQTAASDAFLDLVEKRLDQIGGQYVSR